MKDTGEHQRSWYGDVHEIFMKYGDGTAEHDNEPDNHDDVVWVDKDDSSEFQQEMADLLDEYEERRIEEDGRDY